MSGTARPLGWLATFACGHVSAPATPDGHVYGEPYAGQWITCHDCQGQRRVVRVEAEPGQDVLWSPRLPARAAQGRVMSDLPVHKHYTAEGAVECHEPDCDVYRIQREQRAKWKQAVAAHNAAMRRPRPRPQTITGIRKAER